MIDENRDELSIKFRDDMRHATILFKDETMHAKIYDLPCVVEVWKLEHFVFASAQKISRTQM